MRKNKNLFDWYMKSLRDGADLTFDEAAAVLKISPQEIKNWETGKSFPSKDLWEKLAVTYKVSLQELSEIIEIERALREDKR